MMHGTDGRLGELSTMVEELRATLSELLDYTDAHRISHQACAACDGHCFEEWCVLRDEVRRVLGNGSLRGGQW